MGEISEAAKQARREYQRKWREANRDRVNAKAREWRERNPEKVKKIHADYWERKAQKEGGQDNVTV